MIQFADQVNIRLISQLICGIWGVFQNLIKYFNDTVISTVSVLLLPVWRVIFSLNLNTSVVLLSEKLRIVPSLFETG